MKLHNTLTKKVEELKPLKSGYISVYSCGPTVYDHIHIGNLSSFIFADTLRRVLGASGIEIEHVMNFTDIDDKTIRRSKEKYPKLDAKEALNKLTSEYTEIFLRDMRAIGNDTGAINFIKATASISDMQEHIKRLVDDGFAYITEDGVYFSIAKYKQSGKTYGQLTHITESSNSEARIDNDEYDKESAHDFALWKKQKDGEPAWAFKLGDKDLTGRPGWHIECSAMSEKALGRPFDIHTGGIDLIFPHHENEIAQSTAGRDDPLLSTVFVHNEHLLIDGRKMSKSLKNFYTLEDITKKGFSPLNLRLMLLQTHYRSQSNFTWDSLQAATNRLVSLRDFADLRFQPQQGGVNSEDIKILKNRIETALHNDLATPEAFAALAALDNMTETKGIAEDSIDSFKEFIEWLDEVFGLELASGKDITKEQRALLEDRKQARLNKDWEKSDKLRKQLENEDLGVRDNADGYIWFRL